MSKSQRERAEMAKDGKGLGAMLLAHNATRCIDDDGREVEPNRAPLMSVAPDCATMPGLVRDRAALFAIQS